MWSRSPQGVLILYNRKARRKGTEDDAIGINCEENEANELWTGRPKIVFAPDNILRILQNILLWGFILELDTS